MALPRRRSSESMRRFYNWFFRFYPMVERSVGPIVEEIIAARVSGLPETGRQTAIEYACGSGSLSLVLARHFRAVEGRDLS